MRLYSITLEKDLLTLGFEDDGTIIDLNRAVSFFEIIAHNNCPPPLISIEEMLQDDIFSFDYLCSVMNIISEYGVKKEFVLSEECVINAPIYPGKIIALGNNYHEHIKEMNHKVPEKPVLFGKWPSTVIGHDEPIVKPSWIGRMDYEAELAVVIGRRAKNVKASEAMSHVFGYTCFNDVTARDIQREDLSKSLPWMPSKNFDTFSPMGPCILMAEAVPAPVRINVQCRVNGVLKQNGNTQDLIFDIPTIIEYISSMMTIEPGDVISTGTPVGVGPIEPGDIVEVTCGGIGTLANQVISM